ncbi:tetratricopeptide repeat protein [Labilibacter sediminis]|nr:tetratricopeptide repeat protein [Labilibacter sediminis]
MLMHKLLTYLLFAGLPFLCYANPIDSINQKLDQLSREEKLEALHEHSISLAPTDPIQAQIYARELLKLSKKDQYRYKGLAHYDLGETYYYMELYKEALDSYKKAEPYLIVANDSSRLAGNYSNIGLIYLYQANYKKSLSYYEKSLQLETKLNDSLGVAKSLQNIGIIFGNWSRYEVQEDYYKKALKIYKKLNDTQSIADISLNLGVTMIRQGATNEAYDYYKQALKAYVTTKDSSRIASVYTNLGYYCTNVSQYDEALSYFQKSIQIFKQINEKSGLIHAYTGLGDLMAVQGNNKGAIEMYMKCEEINATVGLLHTQQENIYSLYENYKAIGDFENAIRVLEEYHQIKDSIYSKEQFNKILQLEDKFIHQKNKSELTALKAQNKLYAISSILLLFFLISGGLFAFYYKRSKRLIKNQRLMSLEQKVLRTQMNPHFIFNSLSAIQCYVLDNKTMDAVDFLADFASLMRMVLQYSQEEYITLEQERSILDHYISLQNKRFGDKIKYKIVIDEHLEKSKTMIPPMLAQPFIENSFEHGELYRRENGNITVKFEKKSKNISFCIEDNGIGISRNTSSKNHTTSTHKSLAMKITKERLKLINKNIHNKVGLQVENRAKYGQDGTRVEFTIPLVEMN